MKRIRRPRSKTVDRKKRSPSNRLGIVCSNCNKSVDSRNQCEQCGHGFREQERCAEKGCRVCQDAIVAKWKAYWALRRELGY